MPLPSPDRGTEIERAMAIARASRSPLGFCGRVDDMVRAANGRFLRLPEQLAIAVSRTGAITVVASETTGITTLTPPGAPPVNQPISAAPAPLRELLDRALNLLQQGKPAIVVLLNAHSAAERDVLLSDQLRDLPFDPRLGSRVQVVAVFRDNPLVPTVLRGATGWDIHRIPLPGLAERRAALGAWAGIGVPGIDSIDQAELAARTGGLELDDLRRLIAEHAGHERLTQRRISEVCTAEAARKLVGLVDVDYQPDISFANIVGGDAMKRAVWHAQREDLYWPIALAGPPGVGKSMLATAAARELGIPLVRVNGRLKGGIVGETARNLATFREVVIAHAPMALFWDEFDQLLGRSSDYNGDSGASNEVRQAVLTLLQDAPSLGIFVIAATNNPLSALQYRIRNRLRIIPVLHPTGEEALAIARLRGRQAPRHARRRHRRGIHQQHRRALDRPRHRPHPRPGAGQHP